MTDRVAYSDVDVETLDIDWFAYDREGRIGQFTTGGGVWPPSPARDDKEANAKLLAHIKTQPAQQLASMSGPTPEYERAFAKIAAQGVFAFDVIERHTDHAVYQCMARCTGTPLTTHQLSVVADLTDAIVAAPQCSFELGARIAVNSDGSILKQMT